MVRLSIGKPVRARLSIRPWALALVAVFAVAIGAWAEIEGAGRRAHDRSSPAQRQVAPASTSTEPGGSGELKPHPKVVVAVPPNEAPPPAGAKQSAADRVPSDAEVRQQIAQLQHDLAALSPKPGTLRVLGDGQVVPPRNAPRAVQVVMQAANAISKYPYKWGGGHGAWRDNGYDCSGSISFALAAAGFVDSPLTSGNFMTWGEPGPGRWITIYANPGHVFMYVAGVRYDTGALRGPGHTRWSDAPRSTAGFTAVHPPGY
jgi:cell wall-associated NlpC family hydrolase